MPVAGVSSPLPPAIGELRPNLTDNCDPHLQPWYAAGSARELGYLVEVSKEARHSHQQQERCATDQLLPKSIALLKRCHHGRIRAHGTTPHIPFAMHLAFRYKSPSPPTISAEGDLVGPGAGAEEFEAFIPLARSLPPEKAEATGEGAPPMKENWER